MIYTTIIKNENRFYLHMIRSEELGVCAFKSIKRVIEYWEGGYENAFKRGICGATGAILHHLNHQPSCVGFKDDKDLIEKLKIKMPTIVSIFNNGIIGIQLDYETGNKLWEDGIKPELLKLEED